MELSVQPCAWLFAARRGLDSSGPKTVSVMIVVVKWGSESGLSLSCHLLSFRNHVCILVLLVANEWSLLKSFVLFLGKDLSSRSETDLDCIFGKRRNKKLAQVPAVGVLLSVWPHSVFSLGMKTSQTATHSTPTLNL